jgi:hypothetical protein
VTATQTICHDAEYSSDVELPIAPFVGPSVRLLKAVYME